MRLSLTCGRYIWPALWLVQLVLWPGQAVAQQAGFHGLNPTLKPSQYVHEVWRASDGLPQNSVYAIMQSREGYLWLATQEGLARFDGIRFLTYDKAHAEWLKSNEIWALLEDRAGALWIGTSGGGLVRLSDGQATTYTTENGLPSDLVKALHQDREGHVWIGTIGGGVSRFDGTSFASYDTADGLAGNVVFAIAEDRSGALWFGTSSGLSVLRQGRLSSYSTEQGLQGEVVRALYPDEQGGMWVGTDEGLFRHDRGTLERIQTPETRCGHVVSALYEDRAGALWIGTLDGGVCRSYRGTFSAFTSKEGLSHDQIRSFYEDREGNLWIGTDGGGLNRLSQGKFVPLAAAEGLSNDVAVSVLEDRNGAMWIGTDGGGLNRVEGEQITHFTTADGLTSDYVYALHEDVQGQLWAGTFNGGLCRLNGRRFTCFTTADGLPSNNVWAIQSDRGGNLWISTGAGLARFHHGRFDVLTTENGLSDNWTTAIHEDRAGNLWIGTSGSGLNRRSPDGRISVFSTEDGLSSGFILTLYEDAEGTLWIGMKEGGLCRLASERFTCFTARDGLYNDNVLQILEDDQGYLWLASQKGISRVSKAELQAFAQGQRAAIDPDVYQKPDGLKSNEAVGGSQPNAWKSRDGRLWFATVRGMAVVQPASLRVSDVAPPVLIERLHVNGRPVALTDRIDLAAGNRDVEIDFTGIHFAAPERVRFRYKLEGYDREWIEADARRSAYYTNLPPGAYSFHVLASNGDGIWNDKSAVLAFTIAPFFYQTSWFYLLCVAGLCLAGTGGYWMRTRHLRRRQQELESLVEERTCELRHREEELEVQVERQRVLTEQVRSLASQLTLAEQKERRRVSQILHDDLQQVLYGIQIRMMFLMQDAASKHSLLKEQIESTYNLIAAAIETTRQLTVDLSPLVLNGEGVVEAIQWLNVQMEKVHGLKVDLKVYGEISVPSEDMRVLLFQLVRELLFNVVKHAGVETATVELLESNGHLIIRVEDQGRGIDPTAMGDDQNGRHGFGLYSVRERLGLFGGRLEVESAPGKGTSMTITVPVGASAPAELLPAGAE